MTPRLIIIFGVSACGKTTIAKRIATDLGLDYIEADEFHSPENIQHMTSGNALSDDMREPWIRAICDYLNEQLKTGKTCILAHSCLKRKHRQQFRDLKVPIRFFHLAGDYALIAERMAKRKDHYMPASLLASQFASFESYENEKDVVMVDIGQSREKVCSFITEKLAIDYKE
jgi:gluconokinase